METKSFVGWTSKRRYRVIIKQVEVSQNTVFTFFTEMKDLRQVIRSYVEDLELKEDFQMYVKLNQITEEGNSNVDVQVTVSFENADTRNLFYVPEPVNIYTEKGMFSIEATEEYEIAIAFAAVINIEDYPIKILEVMDGLIDKKGTTSTEMPIYVLLIAYDDELDMYEAFPVSISVNYYPNEELSNSEKGQQERVLQFRDFVNDLVQQDGFMIKNKLEKK